MMSLTRLVKQSLRGEVRSVFCLLPSTSCQLSQSRGFREVQQHKVCVVTGASRGIGFATALELCRKLKSADIYCTTRAASEQLNQVIRAEVGDKADNISYHSMEVTNIDSIVEFRNMVHAKHGTIDILINNAGQYFAPSEEAVEHMRQVEKTLSTNYWGLKNVCKAFLPMLNPAARIVNLSSQLGHLSLIPGADLQRQLADPALTEAELDSLMLQYQDHCTAFRNDFSSVGWPPCAYTVSKVAVNAYTRILQGQLESEGMESVVVNSIHPGSRHSKISQESPLTATDAAKSVIAVALLADPCPHPRGKFFWHDLQIIEWDQGSLKGMWA